MSSTADAGAGVGAGAAAEAGAEADAATTTVSRSDEATVDAKPLSQEARRARKLARCMQRLSGRTADANDSADTATAAAAAQASALALIRTLYSASAGGGTDTATDAEATGSDDGGTAPKVGAVKCKCGRWFKSAGFLRVEDSTRLI